MIIIYNNWIDVNLYKQGKFNIWVNLKTHHIKVCVIIKWKYLYIVQYIWFKLNNIHFLPPLILKDQPEQHITFQYVNGWQNKNKCTVIYRWGVQLSKKKHLFITSNYISVYNTAVIYFFYMCILYLL